MRAGFGTKFTFLLAGMLIWAAHFLFVYGVNGLFCARDLPRTTPWGMGTIPLIVLIATVVAVAASSWIAVAAFLGRGPGVRAEGDPSVREFWRFTTATTAGLAVVAIIWTAVPVLFIQSCA